MTYNVYSGTLNLAQSQSRKVKVEVISAGIFVNIFLWYLC